MNTTDKPHVDPAAISDYCRHIESYLCQKNGGHLVRVVGPAFEEVRGWAEQGVPLKIALRGIDQCCERYFAKGPRRRPIRIEFCAADILELFDDWRRAVGVMSQALPETPTPRKPSLVSHVERVVTRLLALRTIEEAAPLPGEVVDDTVAALDRISGQSKNARGEQREALIEELAALDARLLALVAGSLDAPIAARLRREAEEELAPFGQRISPEARAAAVEAAYLRLVRDAARLPRIRFE